MAHKQWGCWTVLGFTGGWSSLQPTIAYATRPLSERLARRAHLDCRVHRCGILVDTSREVVLQVVGVRGKGCLVAIVACVSIADVLHLVIVCTADERVRSRLRGST